MAINVDGLPNHRRACAEAALPVSVAQQDYRLRRADLCLFGSEGAAQSRVDSEHRKVIARHPFDPDSLGSIISAQADYPVLKRDYVRERVGSAAKVFVVRIR